MKNEKEYDFRSEFCYETSYDQIHTRSISSIEVDIERKIFYTSSDDKSVLIYDYNYKDEIIRLKKHKHKVTSIALAKGSGTLFSASMDRSVIVWMKKQKRVTYKKNTSLRSGLSK